MLVEFKFGNFRSFKEEVTFSMEPLSQNGKMYNLIETKLKKIPRLYRTAGIFGSNASGKSNVLYALKFIKYMIKKSTKMNVENTWPDERYALTDNNLNKPMSFEIQFIVNDILYEYGVEVFNNIIQKESLFYSPIYQNGSALRNRVYNRIFVDGKPVFEKSKGILQRWCDETLNNRLFLPLLINNYNCQIKEVQEAYNELINNIRIADSHSLSHNFSIQKIAEGEGNGIINLLKQADLGINDISVKEVPVEELMKDVKDALEQEPDKLAELILKSVVSNKKSRVLDIKSYHKTEEGTSKEFDFKNMESAGTKTFLSMSGPLLDTMNTGGVIFIDELDNALHPYLVKYLVSLFNNPDINKNNAQLIFTSHAHYLMDGEHLSRDQIWFTSKELNNGFYSDLYSLSDFKNLNRKNISFYEAYMDGVYGAVPSVELL
ncbi:MAG: ATP-binding protein [Alphaproteobacteria bacterium]|nr:ATP-binding protein [Alphaproteobacteria bacterium]